VRVAVLYNAVCREADPSDLDVLDQVSLVREALDGLGHENFAVSVTRDLLGTLGELYLHRPDVAFNLVESVASRADLHPCVPAVLEMIGLPYTGASPATLWITTDKLLTKATMDRAGIPTPPFAAYPDELGEIMKVPGPWIVKPAHEDASIGIDADSVFSSSGDLIAALHRGWGRFAPQPLLVEHFVDGREFNISLLAEADGVQVLPPAEMTFVGYPPGLHRVVGYRAKWEPAALGACQTVRRFHFQSCDNALLTELETISRRCWDVFNLRGYARVDFRVDRNGRPWVLEINANPCLAPDAGFLAAAATKGLSAAQAVGRILRAVSPA